MPHTLPCPPSYRLADHVRACRVSDQVVLLDLQRDKYLGIGLDQQSGLSQAIGDWPAPVDGMGNPSPRGVEDAVLASLLGQNMLVDATKPIQPSVRLVAPTQNLDKAGSAQASSTAQDLLAIAWAASITALSLKHRSLDSVVCHVRQLRRQAEAADDADTPLELRNAVRSYLRLRPFLFTVHDKCLHDSLTLVRFLARKRMYATWVVGVKTRPFGAHSWVQLGNVVLNDVHDHVRRYTPILAV